MLDEGLVQAYVFYLENAVKPLVSARGYKSVPWDTRESMLGESV